MQLEGEVKNVIFRSEDTGYTVLEMSCEDSVFAVVGIFPPVCAGQAVRVEGKFLTHTMHGRQFSAEKIYLGTPSKVEGMKKFLGSGLIKGLGPATAEAIVALYGVNSLEMMRYPISIAKVRGISLKRATEFCLEYSRLQQMQGAVMFLQKLGITVNLALKIYRVFENRTEETVSKNPYVLIENVDGIGFATADRIAESLGIDHNSDFRISAAVVYALKEASAKSGHNFLPEGELIASASALLNLDCDEPEERIAYNIEDMILIGDLVRYDAGEYAAIMLKRSYEVERYIARRLVQLEGEAADFRVDAAKEIERFETENGIKLHPGQAAAIEAAVENGVHVVTGGPGTGKTTIVKCMLRLFCNLGQRVALCAPTGRAAKRLSEATGTDAKTIHRLLELNWKEGGAGYFAYNDSRLLPLDVIIVDEVSMVDEYVFNSLLRAMARGSRLVLVGDKDQLASVGAGNVLSDIISCGKFSVSELTQIYRQSEDSKIVTNAHKINRGEMPELDNRSSDFFFEEKESAEDIARCVTELVTKRLPKYLGTAPIDIQVLCPMKRGSAGVINLNRVLQSVVNPPSPDKKEWRRGDDLFRVGDKVMQTQNNYQLNWTQVNSRGGVETGVGVYNGDIGIIESIDPREGTFKVRFDDDKTVVYATPDVEQLTPAYAVTIHKSQGSEYGAVVVALDANYLLLTRNLLYTAVTRAERLVVVVGKRATVQRMVRNNETARRYSLLTEFIEEECRSNGW